MIYIDGYPMDLAVSESHSFTSEVSEHPVESGANIADHIRPLPEDVDLECIVSDTPIGTIASDPTRQRAGADSPLPSEDAYAHLLAIRNARRPVTIETSLGVFTSMALVSLTVPRSVETSGGLFFSASFHRIVVAENRRVLVPVGSVVAKRAGNYGHKSARSAPAKTIVWKKGLPPGSSPTTTPPGVIAGVEQITIKDGAYLHADGKLLSTAELQALGKDLARDGKSGAKGDKLDRANALLKAQADNPRKYIDPVLFGL